jgi:hypothetical protein
MNYKDKFTIGWWVSFERMSDKLRLALAKVKLKIAFAPLPLGGAGGGPIKGKDKTN